MDSLSPKSKFGLAVLISGRGSNLQSIIDACRIDEFPAKIEIVISDKEDAYGLVRAKKFNIPTRVVSKNPSITKSEFEQNILTILKDFKIDLICLAGFMRILSANFISEWDGKIINIHPSLLPKYKGLDTHQRAIEAKEKESGCTVHFVTAGVDEGEIILQRQVPLLPTDTQEALAARILEQEHIAYPEAIRLLSKTKL
jgi:phosphoribosylglycinamide formyltransferase-1